MTHTQFYTARIRPAAIVKIRLREIFRGFDISIQVHDGKEFLVDNMLIKLEEIHSKMNREASLKAMLTKRETEILRMIVNGHTTKEISETLHLGLPTIESYCYNILLKLNANNTATLVINALESGII